MLLPEIEQMDKELPWSKIEALCALSPAIDPEVSVR